MKFKYLAISMLTLLCTQGMASAASNYIQSGIKHMHAKNFNIAASYFYKAARSNPDCALARYHLANSYVHLKKHDKAIKEYRASLELDPYSIVSGYCKKALIAYKAALPAVITSNEANSKPVKHSQAVMKIRRQLANEKSRHHDYASSLSENVRKAGNVKIEKIKRDAEHQIQMLMDYGALISTGRGYKRTGRSYSSLSRYEKEEMDRAIAEIRRQAKEDIKKEKEIAKKRSNTIDRWSDDRQDALDTVADNLEDQFQHKSSPSGIRLNPVGTGLYVRNYKSVKKRPLPDARYSVARFVDSLEDTKDEPHVERVYRDKQEDIDKEIEEEKVKGSIIVNLLEPQ